MKLDKFQQIFSWGVLAIFVTPILFFPWVLYPFQTGKSTLFLFGVELLFPLFVYLLLKRRAYLKVHPVVATFGLFLLVMFLASLFGVDWWNSLWGNMQRPGGLFLLMHVFVFILYLLYVKECGGDRVIKQMLLFVVGTAVIVSVYGIFEGLGILPTMAEVHLPRASSFFGNPSFFGVYLVLPFWFSLLAASVYKQHRTHFLIAAIVMLFGVLASGTRSAMLALIVSAVVFAVMLFFTKKQFSKKTLLFAGGGALMFVSALIVYGRVFAENRSLIHRMTHLSFGTSSQRLNYWWSALQGLFDQPLFGVGYENFYYIANVYFQTSFYEIAGTWPDKPHNAFLEVLTTGGVLTFLCYVVFLIFLVRAAWKHKQRLYLLPAIAGYLTSIFFLFDGMFTWLSLGFLIVLVVPQGKSIAITVKSWMTPISIGVASVMVVVSCSVVLLPTYRQAVLAQGVHGGSLVSIASLEELSLLYDLPFTSRLRMNQFATVTSHGQELLSHHADVLEEAYTDALTRHPQNAHLYTDIASFYVHRVEYGIDPEVNPLAFVYLDSARTLAPNRIEPLIAEARIYQLQGELDLGILTLEQAVSMADRDPQALGLLGEQYLLAGRTEDAMGMFFRAINAELPDPDHAISHWLIAQYVEREDAAILLHFLRRLIQLHPDEFVFYEMLVSAYDSLEMDREAFELAHELLLLNPGGHPLIEQYVADQL